jgi:hypothetical protein
MRRFVGSWLVLGLLCAAGCSGSGDDAKGPGVVEARDVQAIYADMLTQRDRIQKAIGKGTEMWHEDCAEAAAGAAELETLMTELLQRTSQMPELADAARGVQSHVGLMLGVITTLRDHAVQEVVGMLPGSMIQLDAYMRGLESLFTPEQLGGQSVTTHPNFNPEPPKPPLSPV